MTVDGPGHGWLLTAAERGNPATEIDRERPDGEACSRGNHVERLVHGATYFHHLRAELQDCGPGDQVYFVAWRGDPAQRLDGPGTAIAVELARAVTAGASVNGLIWRSHLDWLNKHAKDNRDFVKMLQVLGASVVLDQRVRTAGSHHQKFLVIRRPGRPESDVAFVGGVDFSYSRGDDATHRGDPQAAAMPAVYGDTPAWHDVHLQIHGPAVADVEACFRERWKDPTALQHMPWVWLYDKLHTPRNVSSHLPTALAPPPAAGGQIVQLLRTYPNKSPSFPFAPRGERSVARGIVKAVNNARRLIYMEDQFLWSREVARVFARALRRNPQLRMVAVIPHFPASDGTVHVAAAQAAQRRALGTLYAAGGERVQIYDLENHDNLPIYVHAKVCVIDDVWATVGSANVNRRSWTHDSELTAAIMDSDPDPQAGGFARDLRLALWREHLDRADGDDTDLHDPEHGTTVLHTAAAALDSWHATGRAGPRPAGRLRRHRTPDVSRTARLLAPPVVRLLFDPDGRPLTTRARRQW